MVVFVLFIAGVRVDIESYKESNHAAFGNGSGIVLVARTSTGCVLGQYNIPPFKVHLSFWISTIKASLE
jgi:hypothetical protein